MARLRRNSDGNLTTEPMITRRQLIKYLGACAAVAGTGIGVKELFTDDSPDMPEPSYGPVKVRVNSCDTGFDDLNFLVSNEISKKYGDPLKGNRNYWMDMIQEMNPNGFTSDYSQGTLQDDCFMKIPESEAEFVRNYLNR